jgi:DNA excision repair protein ERCC-4
LLRLQWEGIHKMIFADSNEEAMCNVVQTLRNWNVPVTVLPQGFDYIIQTEHASVAVERKKAEDYLQSLESGHLNNQLVEMSRNFQLSYLLVYGDMNLALLQAQKFPASYISSLIGSSLKHSPDGLQGQVITINDTAISTDIDVALFLKHLDLKLENADFTRLPKIIRVKLTDEDYALRLLVQLPGIGEKRAKEILQSYGSLESFFFSLSASSPYQKIKGITPQLITQYQSILTKKYENI